MDLDVDLDDERFAPAPADAAVFDLGNVLIRWVPQDAVAAVLGAQKAREFIEHPEFDFAAWNLRNDAGRSIADALAFVREQHPELSAGAVLTGAQRAVLMAGAVVVAVAEAARAAGRDLVQNSAQFMDCRRVEVGLGLLHGKDHVGPLT